MVHGVEGGRWGGGGGGEGGGGSSGSGGSGGGCSKERLQASTRRSEQVVIQIQMYGLSAPVLQCQRTVSNDLSDTAERKKCDN